MNGILNLGWWAALGGVKLLRVFVVCTSLVALWHCDCGWQNEMSSEENGGEWGWGR